MKTTTNYGLNKPEATDFYNVEDFNQNMDTIDSTLKKMESKTNDIVHGGTGATTAAEALTNLGGVGVVCGENNADIFQNNMSGLALITYREMVKNGTWRIPKYLYIDTPYGTQTGFLQGTSETSFFVDDDYYGVRLFYSNGAWTAKKLVPRVGETVDASEYAAGIL